ncbi:MAG: hypothetical protein GY820_20760 [Gammaproteobacteria bacterium]|nr:hypothetical protein [Gammaproteobacteria bacterium]
MKISKPIVQGRLLFISMVVFVLSGCPPPEQFSIYNNGILPASILLVDGSQRHMLPKEILNISDYGEGNIEWRQIEFITNPDTDYYHNLDILCKDIEYSYNLSTLYLYAGASGKIGNSGLLVSKLQLEEDCKLYRVSFDAKFPYEQIYQLTPISPSAKKSYTGNNN